VACVEHRAILNALNEGDPSKLQACMERHYVLAAERMAELLETAPHEQG
jgi:DNA-binding FadR family transcriptional regulator